MNDSTVAQTAGRVALLRAELARSGLTGFIQPRGDEHQGEYVPPHAERLHWLTGFTGSAGLAIVLKTRAVVFADGRYTLQVRTQVDTALFETRHLVDEPPGEWLAANAAKGDRIGFDPRLHTPDGIARLRQGAERAGAELVAVERNLVDAVWPDQPKPPVTPTVPHSTYFAGRTHPEKRADLADQLTK